MKKWKTKPYTIVGWLTLGLFAVIGIVDIVLDRLEDYPTISQYITNRFQDQPLFGYVIIGIMGFLMFHWFFDKSRKE